MSQQPYIIYQPLPARTNGLGIAGFIVSLVGLISCGALSPIGLLLSFIAIFKRPRGFALAGLILGLLGSIWAIIALFVVGLSGLAALIGLGAIMPAVHAETDMAHIAQIIEANKPPDGTITADLGTLPGLSHAQLTDPWGHAYRITVKGPNSFELISDGPDGVAGTGDDLTFEENNGTTLHHRRTHGTHRPVNNVD